MRNPHVELDKCAWCGRHIEQPAPEPSAHCSDACREAYERFAS